MSKSQLSLIILHESLLETLEKMYVYMYTIRIVIVLMMVKK